MKQNNYNREMNLKVKQIWRRIEDECTIKRIPLKELFSQCEVSAPVYYNSINSNKEPQDTLFFAFYKIANFLKLPLDYLIHGVGDKEQDNDSLTAQSLRIISQYYVFSPDLPLSIQAQNLIMFLNPKQQKAIKDHILSYF